MKSEPVTGTQLLAASRATLTVRLPDSRVRTLALSRESLTVYVVHVCILYGTIWNDGLVRVIGPYYGVAGVAAWIVVLAGSMSLLAWLWDECKQRGAYLAAVVRVAVVAALVYVIT